MTPTRVAASAQDAANTPQPAGSAPAGSAPADSNPCPTSCCCTDSCVLFGSRPTRKPRGAHPSGAPLGINPAQARYSNHKLSTTIRERRCTKPRRWIGSRKPPCSRRQRTRLDPVALVLHAVGEPREREPEQERDGGRGEGDARGELPAVCLLHLTFPSRYERTSPARPPQNHAPATALRTSFAITGGSLCCCHLPARTPTAVEPSSCGAPYNAPDAEAPATRLSSAVESRPALSVTDPAPEASPESTPSADDPPSEPSASIEVEDPEDASPGFCESASCASGADAGCESDAPEASTTEILFPLFNVDCVNHE